MPKNSIICAVYSVFGASFFKDIHFISFIAFNTDTWKYNIFETLIYFKFVDIGKRSGSVPDLKAMFIVLLGKKKGLALCQTLRQICLM